MNEVSRLHPDALEPWAHELIELWGMDDDVAPTLIEAAIQLLDHNYAAAIQLLDHNDSLLQRAEEIARAASVWSQDPGFYTPAFDPYGDRAAEDARNRSSPWTARQVSKRLGRYDSHNRHKPFLSWWQQGFLPPPVLAEVLLEVWTTVPTARIPSDKWVAMFRETGFISAPTRRSAPATPLKLWRGSTRHGWRRLAWSQRKETGAWFAWRIPQVGDAKCGVLFEATLDPGDILGVTDERGEFEVIVDPSRLELSRNVRAIRRYYIGDPRPSTKPSIG